MQFNTNLNLLVINDKYNKGEGERSKTKVRDASDSRNAQIVWLV